MREELLRAGASPAEQAEETTLRPRRLDEFVGQPALREHLEIVLGAARQRGQAADHLLFAGPPGLGKTSMAGIVAAEMGVGFRVTSGPVISPVRVVAPTRVNRGRSSRIDRAEGPWPRTMSSSKSSIAG